MKKTKDTTVVSVVPQTIFCIFANNNDFQKTPPFQLKGFFSPLEEKKGGEKTDVIQSVCRSIKSLTVSRWVEYA